MMANIIVETAILATTHQLIELTDIVCVIASTSANHDIIHKA
jgi:hypothetical protein